MKNTIGVSKISSKYAAPETMPTIPTGAAYVGSTPIYPTSFIAHISKPIGRKALCFELRISKHLLDMWISGERKDPIERTKEIMKAAAKYYGPDLPLDIAQYLVTEFGGIVSLARKPKE